MRFGLERMRRLLTALGSPQERFRAVHVVGTNGKSSTVRFTAALLEAHGVRTGSYLSPHLTSFAERIRIGDADLAADAFGAAVQRAAAAAAKVDRTPAAASASPSSSCSPRPRSTSSPRREVEVAVVEAGLGGRYDATNVLGAEVVVLTNVGPRAHALARPDDRRHRGREARGRAPRRDAGARRRRARGGALGARRHRRARSSRPAAPSRRRPARLPAARTSRRAAAAAEALLGRARPASSPPSPASPVPGPPAGRRHDPLTIYDGAHNAPGIAALADSSPRGHGRGAVDPRRQGRRRRCCARCCRGSPPPSSPRAPNPRALPPATLADLARKVGGVRSEIEPDPRQRRRAGAGAGRAEREPCWPPARSTSSPTCSAPRVRGGRVRCERAAAPVSSR